MPRAVVTGAAGFVPSHLCERLVAEGWDVVGFDSLLTGRAENLTELSGHRGFQFRPGDVSQGLDVEGSLDWVLHLASPASPKDYLRWPLETLRVGSIGTENALELACRKGAGFLLASTSEVYGDPLVHPQPEEYWGNVNPVGHRAVYDEAKRYAEALSTAYSRRHEVPVKIVRIFNTYGPRLKPDDGRAVPNFVYRALNEQPLEVHGDGGQTRSLCYVDDLVEGIWRLLTSPETGVINLGNPEETKILELARLICDLTGSNSEIEFIDRPIDDPQVRCPDISRARNRLGWQPKVSLSDGLMRTIEWARPRWRREKEIES
jgi:dTDP-glucose 4,6-dehydratase